MRNVLERDYQSGHSPHHAPSNLIPFVGHGYENCKNRIFVLIMHLCPYNAGQKVKIVFDLHILSANSNCTYYLHMKSFWGSSRLFFGVIKFVMRRDLLNGPYYLECCEINFVIQYLFFVEILFYIHNHIYSLSNFFYVFVI